MDLPFIGKWKLATAAGDNVYADANSGQMLVGAPPAEAAARFNVYGTPAACILQATGGKYVTANAGAPPTTFAATLARTASPATFTITPATANAVTLAWQAGNGATETWSDAKGPLTAKSGSTAQFTQTIVTPALAGLVPTTKMDLSWVYFAGLDLTGLLELTEVDLTGADLTGAELTGMAMDRCVLLGAHLAGAEMGQATLNTAILTDADFTGANLDGAVMPGIHGQRTILSDATMYGAILDGAHLQGAQLIGTKLSGFGSSVVGVDFTEADLTRADFTEASVRTLILTDANLTGVELSNPEKNPSIVLSDATFSAKTNFTRAQLRRNDLRGHDLSNVKMTRADLTGCKLDNTKLVGCEMSYVNLTGATLTGNIPMFGANLSNATLTGANLAGAQLGAIRLLFRIVDDSGSQAAYAAFLKALNEDDQTGVSTAFKANCVSLTAPIAVMASPSAPGRVWTVNAAQSVYTVRLETIDGTSSLATYQPTPAAVLVNAYMKDAILTSANLYDVSASGVQLFGRAMLDGRVILEGASFDDANLSGTNLKQAAMYGINFSYATLTGATLDGSQLTPSASGAQANFANANLQGTSFKDCALGDAILTDAAVAVADADGKTVAGVWLFSAMHAAPIAAQLAASVAQFSLPAPLAAQLVQGTVSASVIRAFATHHVTLSTNAVVVVQAQGPLWTITDGATKYWLFQGCDANNAVPALGVSTSAVLAPAFTIPLYLQQDLNKGGTVSTAVSAAFSAAKHPLDSGASVSVSTMATDWQVVDPTVGGYDLWLGLDLDCELKVTVRPSISSVIDMFTGHSLPLSRRATVTTTAMGWSVDNDSNNPFNAVVNYIKFNLATNATSAEIDAYGSLLRVQQVGPGGASVFANVQISLTALPQAQLQPTTVCPNSARAQTNDEDGLPFNEWMRARALPKPPFCVPSADGAFYCPPSGPT